MLSPRNNEVKLASGVALSTVVDNYRLLCFKSCLIPQSKLARQSSLVFSSFYFFYLIKLINNLIFNRIFIKNFFVQCKYSFKAMIQFDGSLFNKRFGLGREGGVELQSGVQRGALRASKVRIINKILNTPFHVTRLKMKLLVTRIFIK